MYFLVILLPFLSCFIGLCFGRFLGFAGVILLSISSMFFLVLISLFIFYEVGIGNTVCVLDVGTWYNNDIFFVKWSFFFDSLTASMLVVITVISFLVHLFSVDYMKEDPHLGRFLCYLTLFTLFMLLLVTAGNFVQLFLGWEGVGLASYLLINFWYSRMQANKSAIKAIILNRIGDFGLILGICGIFYSFKSLDFLTLYNIIFFCKDLVVSFCGIEIHLLSLISFFLFVGAVGKSAQIGLHVWLPDAMEGPTPVSALIHAATMVTAGVFLLLRCSPILEFSAFSLMVITFIGSLTAFFAGTAGLVQNDIKRVIAYSTCSQLGYMVFACGLSNYSVSFFHLMNHAFFKALLFLSAGAIIHALFDEQDLRKMGGLVKLMPFVYVMMLIGSLSLMGFPFLTGFYSKDLVLEIAYSHYTVGGTFAFWLGVLSAVCTAFYSMRLLFLAFLVRPNGYKVVFEYVHESSFIVIFVLGSLCVGSVFVGYLFKDALVGLGSIFWQGSLYYSPFAVNIVDAEFLYYFVKLIPVVFSFFGILLAFFIYNLYYSVFHTFFDKSFFIKNVYTFLIKKWYFDQIYNYFISRVVFYLGYNVTYKVIDQGFFQMIGPLGISRFVNKLSLFLSVVQSGFIFHYVFFLVCGLYLFFIFSGFFFVDLFVGLEEGIFYLLCFQIYIYFSNKRID